MDRKLPYYATDEYGVTYLYFSPEWIGTKVPLEYSELNLPITTVNGKIKHKWLCILYNRFSNAAYLDLFGKGRGHGIPQITIPNFGQLPDELIFYSETMTADELNDRSRNLAYGVLMDHLEDNE